MSVLSDSEVEHRLAGVAGWHVDEQRAISRELTFASFTDAMAFVNRVAEAAEAVDHHPDILLHGWSKVRLTLSTHSQGGLTDADFRLAAQIDRLA